MRVITPITKDEDTHDHGTPLSWTPELEQFVCVCVDWILPVKVFRKLSIPKDKLLARVVRTKYGVPCSEFVLCSSESSEYLWSRIIIESSRRAPCRRPSEEHSAHLSLNLSEASTANSEVVVVKDRERIDTES